MLVNRVARCILRSTMRILRLQQNYGASNPVSPDNGIPCYGMNTLGVPIGHGKVYSDSLASGNGCDTGL
jgi:hypothetical protein